LGIQNYYIIYGGVEQKFFDQENKPTEKSDDLRAISYLLSRLGTDYSSLNSYNINLLALPYKEIYEGWRLDGLSPAMNEEVERSSITFKWEPVNGANTYIIEIYRKFDSSFVWKIFIDSPSKGSFSLPDISGSNSPLWSTYSYSYNIYAMDKTVDELLKVREDEIQRFETIKFSGIRNVMFKIK